MIKVTITLLSCSAHALNSHAGSPSGPGEVGLSLLSTVARKSEVYGRKLTLDGTQPSETEGTTLLRSTGV